MTKKLGAFALNKIHCGDSAVLLKQLPTGCIDLTVTSPPYDNLRAYNGHSLFDFETIAQELYRVTKNGGVVVWIVGDATINGSETGSSFRQALYFMQCGFKLYDTMIYWKNAFAFLQRRRYAGCFEFMFVFSKGRPKTVRIARVETNAETRARERLSSYRQKTGDVIRKVVKGRKHRPMENIWLYDVGYMKSTTDKIAYSHPAIFPESLARDHILSWSKKGDVVLDCFAGAGTTLKMAKIHERRYLGFEISQEYCAIAEKRILLARNGKNEK